MSKLYMSHISDGRKEVTKRGHNDMSTHIRGWDSGIKVLTKTNNEGDVFFEVYKTGGSNNPSNNKLIYETMQEM